MRKVLMMVALAGATFSLKAGDEEEFEDEEAQRLVDAKIAKFVDSLDEFTQLKAKADELGVKYAKKTTLEELSNLIKEKEESISFDALKAKADELQLSYTDGVTAIELTKLIEEAEKK